MCNPHLEATWRKKLSHFQGTGSTQQESNYLLSFILHYHSYYFSKNCMVEPHHVLLGNEKNLKYCPKGTYQGSSWSTSLEGWKPYKMIRNSAFVYSASAIQGWDEWPYLCLKRLLVQFSCSVLSDSLWPHGLQHARLPCPSPTPEACSNPCPLSWWCHPTSVVPFSFCLWSFLASGSFPVSQFFTPGGQSIGVSASTSVLPMNIPFLSPRISLIWYKKV